MSERIAAPHVGAPDPEVRTSPILEHTDEYYAAPAQQLSELAGCDSNYRRGKYACSGDELLRCQDSLRLRRGTRAPTNP